MARSGRLAGPQRHAERSISMLESCSAQGCRVASADGREAGGSTEQRCKPLRDSVWPALWAGGSAGQDSCSHGRTAPSPALCRMQSAEHPRAAPRVAQKAQRAALARLLTPAHPAGTVRSRWRHGRLVRGTCGRVPVLYPLAILTMARGFLQMALRGAVITCCMCLEMRPNVLRT